MLANSIHDELLTIPGIAGAELEGASEQPVGVRVQLAVGADVDMVGREVQRVLAAHGMRSQLTRDDESILPPGSVVNLSDYEVNSPDPGRKAEIPAALPAVDAEMTDVAAPAAALPAVDADAEVEALAEAEVETEAAEPSPTPTPMMGVPAAGIAGVAVDEDATRVVVTVRSTAGQSAQRSAPSTPGGLDEAAAMAAADLASPEGVPRIVAITDTAIEGSAVVNVVFEVGGGERVAGASVIRANRAAAIARAAWAALAGAGS